jgi:hypothetical protein
VLNAIAKCISHQRRAPQTLSSVAVGPPAASSACGSPSDTASPGTNSLRARHR